MTGNRLPILTQLPHLNWKTFILKRMISTFCFTSERIKNNKIKICTFILFYDAELFLFMMSVLYFQKTTNAFQTHKVRPQVLTYLTILNNLFGSRSELGSGSDIYALLFGMVEFKFVLRKVDKFVIIKHIGTGTYLQFQKSLEKISKI
jgi:hypothetical protein